MTQPMFTPGPWTVHAEDLRGGRYWSVVVANEFETIDLHEDENGEANARLIAAGPDLYEALASLHAALVHDHNRDLPYWQAARAALAKAEPRP